ncbi:MAG: GNAT family acetyltransferase [Thermodesulfobacteriota bacterium]
MNDTLQAESRFRIRPFRIEDQTSVIELWGDCGLVVPANDPEADIQAKLKVQPELFLVGTLDEEVMATAMAGYEGHRGWINYLAVAPDYRRRGYGRRLMRRVEEILGAIGCPKINLQVRTGNTDVIRFYKRIGYTEDAVVSLGKRLPPQASSITPPRIFTAR